MSSSILILVDGTCVFCTGLVSRILRHPRGAGFRFAHLQSQTAQQLLARHGLRPDIDTIYAVTDHGEPSERVWLDGEAGRRIWPRLYPVAAVLRWVPLALLNLQYRLFARIRYRLFGQAKGCIVPTEQERRRFLA